MAEVRAVAFDLGGVLIQIHHEWQGATAAAGLKCQASGPLGGFPEFDEYQMGAIDDDRFLSSLCDFLSAERDDAKKVHMAVLREAYRGTAELVKELTSRGILCGCISNTNALHWERFFDGASYEFGPMLEVRIGSHLVGASKPDPAIFAAFERACGIPPAAIAFFDDNPANVEAAARRGWQVRLVDPSGDTVAQMRSFLGPDKIAGQ
jgi:FMN phosphatase YigB (HAD superfamily)